MRIIDLLFVFAISFAIGFSFWTSRRLYDDEAVIRQSVHAIGLIQQELAKP